MDALVGSALTIAIELQGPAGSLPATNNSAAYTVYGHDGSVITGPIAFATNSSWSVVSLQMDALWHTIAVGRKFEKRMVRFTWLSGGRSYERRVHYRVVPLLAMSVSPADVRGMIGVTDDELPDTDIDLVAAYFQIEDEITSAVLSAALVEGGVKELNANRAIAAQAALATLSSLQLRIASSVSDGVQKFARMARIDFDKLASALSGIRTEALASATGTTTNIFTGIALSTPTDVITGA